MSFKQQSNYAAKLKSSSVHKLSLPEYKKNMTEGAKNNYALFYKIRSDFFIIGPNFLKFSVDFLTAEED